MSTGAGAIQDPPAQAWTLDSLAAGLERCRHNGSLVLSAATLEAQEVDDLLGAVGLTELVLDGPELERTDDRISVSGTATLFGVPAVDGHATFVVADGALSVALNAAFGDEERIQILGLPWASIEKLALALNVTGPSLPVPVVTVVLSGAIELEGQPKPIEVTLTPSFGGSDWLLRATDIPLPDFSALAALLPGQDADAITPPKLAEAGGFEIVELSCGFDPTEWTVHSLAATVGAPGKEWELAPGLPTLRDVFLSVGLEFESGAEGDDAGVISGDEGNGAGATTTAGDVKSVNVSAGATVTLGKFVDPDTGDATPLDLPVRITRQPEEWRVGILGAHGFPSLGELVATVADPDTAALLPAGLHELKMDSATLELTLGSGDPTLRSIFFSTQLADHWPIVEGFLELEHVALQLSVDRAGGDTSGFFAGGIRLGDVELPVVVEKPGGSAPWRLALGSDAAPTLSGLSALSGVVGGGDVAGHLPAGFGDGALTLRDLSMEFDPKTHSVSSIAVDVRSAGPWRLPELTNFDVRDLTLKLRVTAPGDSEKREVTGTISGTVDLAGPAITISASKRTAASEWELEGALAPGPPLNLTTLAQRVLPGTSVLPADVPDLVLTTADLKVTPATGAIELNVGSDGPWHVPVGVTGVQVSALRVDLKRPGSGGEVTGSLAGRLSVAGSGFDVVYTLPGDLVLSGHFDSVPLSGLAGDLLGPGFVEALPAPFNAFELKNLDVTVAPARGRFAASAELPGFDEVAVLLARSADGSWGFALALAPAASWRLSSLSSSLSVLDDLSFGNTVLIVSTAVDGASLAQLPVVRDRLKTDGKLAVGQGVTLVADLALDGTGAEHVLGMKELRVRASIESVDKLTLEAVLAGPFQLGKTAVLREVDFRLTIGGSAGILVGLFGQIEVTLDADNKLLFTGGVAVTPDELKCAVTMDGTWKEPFGATGVSVSDVALELDWSFVDDLPGIGIAGRMQIGDFHGAVAVKFDAGDPSQSMVAVSFDSLKLADVLTSLCHEIFGDAIPPELVQTVFDISFKDVEIYVVPRDTTIGTHEYKQGTRLKARMFFWGIEADADVEIDYAKGLVVDGKVDPIVLGDVFTLKGAGTEPKPKLHLEVTTGKVPKIDMEGAVSLLGLSSETTLSLSDTGFEFETTGKIFDLFTCTLEVRGGHLGDTNGFLVKATMENDLFEYLRVHAEQAIQQAAKDADSGIASAENDVRDAQAKVAGLQQQIDDRRREIGAEREETRRTLVTSETATVQTKQEALADLDRQISELYGSIQADRTRDTQSLVDAQRDVQAAQSQVDTLLGQIDRMRVTIQADRDQDTRKLVDAQAAVDAAQRNVDSILGDIRQNESWWNSLPDIDWPANPSHTRDAVWYYPKIGGMYTAYGTATAALKLAQGVLEAAKAVQTLPPIEMDPRISGLYADYGLATAALTTAQGVLEAAKAVQTAPPIDADPRLVTLYAERATVQAALDAAVTALSLVQSAGDVIPVDMDPEIVGLTTAMGAAQLGLQAAQGILEATRVTVAGTLEVSEYIVHYGLGGLIDVRKASFEAGLDAVHGGDVRLSADLEFLGTPQHVEFDFNFTDPLSGVENLVKVLVAETSAAAA